MRVLPIAILLVLAAPALADRDLCAPGTRFRGTPLDLDVKDTDVHDVFRLLSDVGKTNLVVADDVAGKVTLRLKRVPWDQIACTIAAVHKLQIMVQGNILMVSKKREGRYDIDGDGFDDAVLDPRRTEAARGACGRPSHLQGYEDRLVPLGDVDKDGRPDFAYGAYVYRGAKGGVASTSPPSL